MGTISNSNLHITSNPRSSNLRSSIVNYRSESHTSREPVCLRHEWTISNFRSILTSGQRDLCLRSSIFKGTGIPKVCWQMCFYPCGGVAGSTDNGSLFLEMSSLSANRKLKFKVKHKYLIEKYDYISWSSNSYTNEFTLKPTNSIQFCGVSCIPISTMRNFIQRNDSLLIVCEMEFEPDTEGIVCKEIMLDVPNSTISSHKKFISRLSDVYNSNDFGIFADCQIKCGKKVFRANKFMLVSQSSVFKAMFTHKNTEESLTNCVTIVDSTPGIVSEMINFIYTAELSECLNDDELINVLALAEKYDIQQLKSLCQDELIFQLSDNNVCNFLEIAEQYRADSLKEACIETIVKYRKTITKSHKWKVMKVTHPALVLETLETIMTADGSPPLKKEAE